MIFENLPTTPTSEELIDQAFSRAARAGRAKSGTQAQQSMLQTASNVLSDNLGNVATEWPDFREVDPFYYELADAIVDVDELRQSLSEIQWASRKTKEIGREYQGKLVGDLEGDRKIRKQGFARLADVVEEVEDDLALVGQARNDLRDLPEIDPDEPTIVVAGYPNVGKSSFVNAVTNARNEIAEYPFTTKGVHVGHFDGAAAAAYSEGAGRPAERDHIRYQIVDTPGLLDRPEDERNDIENQAVSALTNLADAIVFVVDASGYCGYPLDAQLELRDALAERFGDVPVLTVCNKADLSTDVEADAYMSIEQDENVAEQSSAGSEPQVQTVDEVLDDAVEAVGYELELPFDDQE